MKSQEVTFGRNLLPGVARQGKELNDQLYANSILAHHANTRALFYDTTTLFASVTSISLQ